MPSSTSDGWRSSSRRSSTTTRRCSTARPTTGSTRRSRLADVPDGAAALDARRCRRSLVRVVVGQRADGCVPRRRRRGGRGRRRAPRRRARQAPAHRRTRRSALVTQLGRRRGASRDRAAGRRSGRPTCPSSVTVSRSARLSQNRARQSASSICSRDEHAGGRRLRWRDRQGPPACSDAGGVDRAGHGR